MLARRGAGKGGKMGETNVARRGAGFARSIILLTLLLAACGPREPAPVVSGNESAPPPAQVIVERGQTLSGIAQHYHVPMHVVAEANHLSPPYRILVGQALIIPGVGPGVGEPAAIGPSVAMATAPTPSPQPPIRVPLPPPEPVPVQPIPLDRPPPASSAEPPAAAPPPAAALTPPVPATPSRTAETLTSPKGSVSEPTSSAAGVAVPQPSAAPGPTASAEPPQPHGSGAFLWPVRGHVLENYGAGPDGTHNDGINIGAARGAPVQAADAGVVAYAGNELRGYGNLILIKHPNGWISAYAHCDLILVKTGQKVARGQVIARVGSTGNVSEPQLHFELRRGKHPVDPRDYMAPLPTATAESAHPS
jgi:murein DD-endopeptidase MepM/ murein hydrolase activator NlpD